MTPRPLLAAVLLVLAACGPEPDRSAAPAADSAGAAPATVDVPGGADDRARRMADSANAAVRAREAEVEALSRDAAGGGR